MGGAEQRWVGAEDEPRAHLSGGRGRRCRHEGGRPVRRRSEQRELRRPSGLQAWPRPRRSAQAENLAGDGWRGDEGKHVSSPAARAVEDVEAPGSPQEPCPIQAGTWGRSARTSLELWRRLLR